MRGPARRELTYEYEHEDQVERGRKGGQVAGRKGGQVKEPAYDLNTCEAPICVETRRIICARGSQQRTPKAWEGR